jgi:hypothetical protein
MSQVSSQDSAAPPPRSGGNGLGVAGFIVSLVGTLACGTLAPLGLLLSLVAVFKRPRGFALAGIIIGLLGSALLAAAGFGIVMGALGLKGAAEVAGREAMFVGSEEAIVQYYQQQGRLPDDAQAEALLPQVDPGGSQWVASFKPRYERLNETEFRIALPGPDGQHGTADDITRQFDVSAGGSHGVPSTPGPTGEATGG